MRTSLVIPCISAHFTKNGIYKTLDSIYEGTILPNEVIIVLCETKRISPKSIEMFKTYWEPKFDRLILLTFPNIQSCGKNRSIGNLQASNDIIINADADDIFHPQRIETFLYFFRTTNALAITHLYIPSSRTFKKYEISKIKLAADSNTLFKYYFPDNKWRNFPKKEYYPSFLNLTTNDGHMAFRREVLKKVNHTDQDANCDGLFLYKLLYHFKKNIVIHACLSKYSKGDYWIKRFPKMNTAKLERSLDGEKSYTIEF